MYAIRIAVACAIGSSNPGGTDIAACNAFCASATSCGLLAIAGSQVKVISKSSRYSSRATCSIFTGSGGGGGGIGGIPGGGGGGGSGTIGTVGAATAKYSTASSVRLLMRARFFSSAARDRL
jgi:hypothetical protein